MPEDDKVEDDEADDADEEASEDGEAELFVDGDELEDS